MPLDQTAVESNSRLPSELRCGKSQPMRDVIIDESQALVKPETAILQNSIIEPVNTFSAENSEIMIRQVKYCRCK